MAGILSFSSLRSAINAGFQVCGTTRDGYLVRARTTTGWALAVVTIRPDDTKRAANLL